MTLRPIPRPTKKGSWWLFQLLPTGAVAVLLAAFGAYLLFTKGRGPKNR